MQHRNAAAAHQAHATSYIWVQQHAEMTVNTKGQHIQQHKRVAHHMALHTNVTTSTTHWCKCQLASSISIAGSQISHMYSAVNWFWGIP